MGVAIGYAMKRLGYELSVVETDNAQVEKFRSINDGCVHYRHITNVPSIPDIIISALPYHATTEVALWAINKGIRYCDLGGSVPTSEVIAAAAKASTTGMPVMTDLGLAPGWINLIAEELYGSLPDASKVKMMVGGIPETKVYGDPLNYMLTWSVDGLINEYKDTCEILLENEVHLVQGMGMCENVNVAGMELEAFCTSGASAHSIPSMKKRGVWECIYKTLRWRGHCQWIDFLMRSLDRQTLEEVLTESSKCHSRDMVVMHVEVKRENSKLTKTHVIPPRDSFTAMQRSTAFSIASVADILAGGKLDGKQYPLYEDVPIKKFNENLTLLMDGDI